MQHPVTNFTASPNSGEASTELSMEQAAGLYISVPVSKYFECEKRIGEWVDKAEIFSLSSKTCFYR